MLFIILSLLDVVAGAAIFSPKVFEIIIGLSWALTVIILFKGVYSIASSFSANYYFEWPGFLDVIAGLALFLISYDFVSASRIIGSAIAIKGAYYLSRSVLKI